MNKGKILGIGAVGLALLKASKNAKKSTVVQDVAPLAFGNSDLDNLVSQIKSNGAIRTLLKGEKGDSVKGDKGDTGLAGSQILNYGGSLIKNGAFELGNADGWNNVVINGEYEGLPIGENTVSGSNSLSDFFSFNPNKIYRLELFGQNLTGLSIQPFSIDNQRVNNTINTNPYNFILPFVESGSLSSTTINKVACLFGGKAVNSSFSSVSNAKKAKVSLYVNSGQVVKFTNIVIKEVSLGEPLPHNLPFLPLNQTVLNNTTGKVGIFNGTTVDYYF